MAEIYRDATNKAAVLSVTGGTGVSAVFVRNGVTTPAGSVVANSVSIPYSITYTEGEFDVVWTYTIGAVTYTRTDHNDVVAPYFIKADLDAFDPDMATLTSDQVIKLERLVRSIIDVYTGQHFGLETGSETCYGNNDTVLMTEKRVVSITSVAEASLPDIPYTVSFRPVNRGYAIEMIGYAPGDDIKVPAYEEQQFAMYAPLGSRFLNNVAYIITGTFGWHDIPFDVNLAALHLAQEFSCDETLWRDRYIKSIKGEGFDIEFRSDAFTGTGSVIADQLLGKYIANKLAII